MSLPPLPEDAATAAVAVVVVVRDCRRNHVRIPVYELVSSFEYVTMVVRINIILEVYVCLLVCIPVYELVSSFEYVTYNGSSYHYHTRSICMSTRTYSVLRIKVHTHMMFIMRHHNNEKWSMFPTTSCVVAGFLSHAQHTQTHKENVFRRCTQYSNVSGGP